jgi:hypothetical protein
MPRKRPPKPKLVLLAERIAEARRIIDAQQVLLEKLRVVGAPTLGDESALRTYISSLTHLLAHERKEKEAEAKAEKTNSKVSGKSRLGRGYWITRWIGLTQNELQSRH